MWRFPIDIVIHNVWLDMWRFPKMRAPQIIQNWTTKGIYTHGSIYTHGFVNRHPFQETTILCIQTRFFYTYMVETHHHPIVSYCIHL